MKVGNRIKEIRENTGISQSELAFKTDFFNQSQICKIENGSRTLKVDELNIIAIALNVSLLDLLS